MQDRCLCCRSRRGLRRERLPKTQPIQVVVKTYADLNNAAFAIRAVYVLVVSRTESYYGSEREHAEGRFALCTVVCKALVYKEHGVRLVPPFARHRVAVCRARRSRVHDRVVIGQAGAYRIGKCLQRETGGRFETWVGSCLRTKPRNTRMRMTNAYACSRMSRVGLPICRCNSESTESTKGIFVAAAGSLGLAKKLCVALEEGILCK